MELILVCDDDREIVDAIKIYLSGEGFEVLTAYDGEEAIKLMAKHKVDLLIIDIMMPVLDGIRATMQIRENSTIPIIMLSAKSEDADKILGLNIGADDYLTKPFNPLELVARVKSQLRRYKKLGNMSMPEPQRVVVGDLEIDDETKEVVVAGELILQLAQQYHTPILPVDSEHSAIFQSLVGEDDNEIEKILLTCSGGPFRTFTHEQLKSVTAADALKHPTWEMGAKITIDSASLMNKGFEVIEAKWLFGVPADKIQVLIHPQSIVHSAVQFVVADILKV